jgi:hypothetical protein
MIYHVVENTCYQKLTNGLAIPNMAKMLGIECKTYTVDEFQNAHIDYDSTQEAVFITESAFFRNRCQFTPSDLRKRIRNGKIVNLSSDAIMYNYKGFDEIDCKPEDIDLWLDLMDLPVQRYKSKGFKVDKWKWTISAAYIDQIEKYDAPKYNKETDYVCLAQTNSVYRKNLKNHLASNRLIGTFGNGCLSSELPDLYKLYNQAKVCIGTSSPAGLDNIQTNKGFRDWIAPFFGTILIYDDFSEMDWVGPDVPRYCYDEYTDLVSLINTVKWSMSDEYYNIYIEKQKKLARNNTLEKQFIQLFKKHDIL